MENKHIKILTVHYDTEIKQHEVALFRGAVIASMKDHANTLFHNHLDNEKYRYSYPLIQYKRIDGKAAIVCLGEGTDVIAQFIAEGANKFRLGEREVEMSVDKIQPRQILVQGQDESIHYHLQRWLPLNSENYNTYHHLDSLTEKLALLERILCGNILSFAKGLGITIENEIEIKITNITEPYLVKHKANSLMAFDLDFKANTTLPDFIGLGKNVSIGFGVVSKKKNG